MYSISGTSSSLSPNISSLVVSAGLGFGFGFWADMVFFFDFARSSLRGGAGVWKDFVFAFVVFAPNGARAFVPFGLSAPQS